MTNSNWPIAPRFCEHERKRESEARRALTITQPAPSASHLAEKRRTT